MLSCNRLRYVAAASCKRLPQQLRLLADEKSMKHRLKRKAQLRSKQIGQLVQKRDLLALIGEYIELQEQYVASRLRSNKMLIEQAQSLFLGKSE